VPGNRSQPETNHRSLKGHNAWTPYGALASAPSQSSGMCDDQARPQASPRYGSATHPMRVDAVVDLALTHPVTATEIIVIRIAVGMLWVAVRCTGR
jgi:hypothetical protein